MKLPLIAAFALAATANSALAGGVAFRFGDDSFGVSVAGDLSSESSAQFYWLHHEDDADLVSLGLYANGRRGALTGRVGAKAVTLTADDSGFDGGAVAFGGDLSLPINDVLRLRSGLYYGPEATTYSDVDGYREWSISAEISIFQNSAIQLGFGDIEFNAVNGGEFDFEDGPFLRLQLRL